MFSRHLPLFLFGLLFAFTACAQPELPPNSDHFKSEMVPMRDGIKLFTTIDIPQPGRQYPVQINRTPYRRKDVQIKDPGDAFSKHAFIRVTQDVRGTGRSEGVWDPFTQEINDGQDCLEWLARQPWCNGRIIMTGGSYLGNTQLLAAASGNPALKAITPAVIAFDYLTPPSEQHGVPPLAMLKWSAYCTAANLGIEEVNEKIDVFKTPWAELDSAAIGRPIPFWQTMLVPEKYDRYWNGLNAAQYIEKIPCPAFLLSGWYDIDATAELNLFNAFRTRGATERIRNFSRCVMGPYTHGGLIDFPGLDKDKADRRKMDQLGRTYRERLCRDDTKDPLPDYQPLTYFVMGANEWRGADAWPPAGTTFTPYYLSGGKANTASGNGALSTDLPDSPADTFISNPANPVPTVGGRWSAGAKEQIKPLGKRQDVLFFRSPKLTAPLEIAGPVRAKLFFTCSTPETDIAVKVADVFPDGTAYNIVNGIKRTSYRSTPAPAEPLQPGQVYELDFELQSTAHRFLPDHQILVIIAGQEYGYFTFNRNTGKGPQDAEIRTAEISILHTKDHPSAVILPVSKLP